ncbi:MAG: EAL domain-containing protein [Ketobacter sp.]|nr:MAG: EAL domain-containing protein [Ketobacter sp.]
MIHKVFVVDDSQVQCQHAADLCSNVFDNVHISMAYNGRQALDQLQHTPADLVLIDLEMPVMDGIELISELSQRQLASAVIIMSAKDAKLISSVGVMAEAGGLHVLGCYQKPITKEVLQEAANKFAAGNKADAKAEDEERKITGQDITAAVASQHFSLHYQPKLTTRGIILKGVEALARWNHPELGFISPVRFIDAAEQFNQITPLTMHLFHLALEQKAFWKKHGLRFSLAFNLSPMVLLEDDLISWIEEALNQHGIAPDEIIFEVTENVMLGDVAKCLQTLTRLRLKGFGIALDDYGTGFANAEQLMRLPATELKIDRSLVHEVSRKPQLEKIVSSTVKLAKDLNLAIVAEGVEQLEDFITLTKFEVTQVQGYYFSRPLAADTFTNWVTTDLKLLRGQIKGALENLRPD